MESVTFRLNPKVDPNPTREGFSAELDCSGKCRLPNRLFHCDHPTANDEIYFSGARASLIFPRADRDAKAAADAMVKRFADSWNHQAGAAYGENYWPEAELVNPSGAILNGQKEIVQEQVGIWAVILKGSRVSGTVRKIPMLGPNYMVVDLTYKSLVSARLRLAAPRMRRC